MRNSLFFTFSRETKIAICKETNFPSEIAIAIVDVDDSEMALAFLDRKDLLGDDLHEFVKSKHEVVRAKVAQNKNIGDEDLKTLLNDVSDTVVIEALKNPNITADILNKCVKNLDFIYSHDKSVILEISRLETVQTSQILSLIELDEKNYQIFSKDKKLTLDLILNVIGNKNFSDLDVNQLMVNIFYDYFDRDEVDVVIQILEKMIEVRPYNDGVIPNIFPNDVFKVLSGLSIKSYNNCSPTLYNMAFSELIKWYDGKGVSVCLIDKLLEIIANLVCSKYLNYDKLRRIIEIIDFCLKYRSPVYNNTPEIMYVNILENLTNNGYLTEESIRLIYKKIRIYSNVLSFDVSKLMENMCENPNTPYDIKELYMEI